MFAGDRWKRFCIGTLGFPGSSSRSKTNLPVSETFDGVVVDIENHLAVALYRDGIVWNLKNLSEDQKRDIIYNFRLREDIINNEVPVGLYKDGIVWDLKNVSEDVKRNLINIPPLKEDIAFDELPVALYDNEIVCELKNIPDQFKHYIAQDPWLKEHLLKDEPSVGFYLNQYEHDDGGGIAATYLTLLKK